MGDRVIVACHYEGDCDREAVARQILTSADDGLAHLEKPEELRAAVAALLSARGHSIDEGKYYFNLAHLTAAQFGAVLRDLKVGSDTKVLGSHYCFVHSAWRQCALPMGW
jgi:hypothetical protein